MFTEELLFVGILTLSLVALAAGFFFATLLAQAILIVRRNNTANMTPLIFTCKQKSNAVQF